MRWLVKNGRFSALALLALVVWSVTAAGNDTSGVDSSFSLPDPVSIDDESELAKSNVPLADHQPLDPFPAPQESLSAEERIEQLERTVEALQVAQACDQSACLDHPMVSGITHYPTYDGGWTLRPFNPDATPFELRTELHHQIRYTYFENDDGSTINLIGLPQDIVDRNDFDINRGRIVFTGYALDPNFGYYVNIDYSTVASNSIQPLLAWLSYNLNEDLQVFAGLGKVPGTWEWQQTSRFTHGIDRSLATTFFRPSISAGIWATGNLTPHSHFTAFIGDGFNTLTLRPDQLDTNLAYSFLSWCEPLGEFGLGFSDIDSNQNPVVRLGHGLTHTRNDTPPNRTLGPEETAIRLSNGVRLVSPGAVVPGESVNEFDIWLYSVHTGYKHQGCSVSGEYFFRWLDRIRTDAGTSFDTIFDHGFFLQAGKFVVPATTELYARGSGVYGDFGDGYEIALGINYHPFANRNVRSTLEWTGLNDSPAQQSRTGYVAGGNGDLVRLQLWAFF